MDPYKAALENFYTVSRKYADTGANDSEPQWVLMRLVREKLDRRIVTVPSTRKGWQLYTPDPKGENGRPLSGERVQEAARELAKAAREVLKHVPTAKW